MTSVRSPLRNFNNKSSKKHVYYNSNNLNTNNHKSPSPSNAFIDIPNLTLHLTHISKMIDDSVLKFTKKYLVISTELEEMKREFISHSALMTEYLTLTKKEIRFDKFDSFKQGKQFTAARNYPLYEQKLLQKSIKPNNNKKSFVISNYNTRIFSPEIGMHNHNKCTNNVTINASDLNLCTNSSMNTSNNNSDVKQRNITAKLNKKTNLIVSNNNHNNTIQYSSSQKNNCKSNVLLTTTPRKVKKKNYPNKKTYTKSTNEMNDNEKLNYHNKIINTITNNNKKIKAMYIIINKSKLLTYKDNINISYINHEIASRILPSNILYDNISHLENEMNNLLTIQNQQIFPDKDEYITKAMTYPSRTAVSGLNYLSNERELQLFQDETMAYTLYIMIANVLGVQQNDNNNNTNVQLKFQDIYNTYNVSSLQQLFKEIIYDKVYNLNNTITQSDIQSMIECIENNKDVITDNLVTNGNKTFSYIAFSLEEISEYLNLLLKIKEDEVLMKKYIRAKRINEIENELIELNKKMNNS